MRIRTLCNSLARLICAAVLWMGIPHARADVHASATAQEAERIVREFAQQSQAPGLAVSVGRGGRLVWSAGFGLADLEQQVAVDPARTRFRVGSVAKPMTALALAQLVSAGRVNLDAEVQAYVPEFPTKDRPVTLRQLAGHLGGIRHYANNEAYLRSRYAGTVDALALFKDDPLVATPGEAWKYSSYGYNLLSAAIERAADQPFLAHLREAVFLPLGMNDTVPDQLEQIVPQRGRYYRRHDGALLNEPEVDNSYKWASGGLLSTTDDLVRFGLAHMDARRVAPETLELLWTEQTTARGEATGYALGWRIVVDAEGQRWIGHGGGSIGGTSQLWLLPEHGLVFAMASNLTELDYADVLPRLVRVFAASQASPDPKP